MTPHKPPNCLRCIHFYISGDTNFPYACRAFELQSKRLPALEVFLATGQHCPVFERNPKIKDGDPPAPLDKKGWLA